MTVRYDNLADSKMFDLDLPTLRRLERWFEEHDSLLCWLQDEMRELERPAKSEVRDSVSYTLVFPTPFADIGLGEIVFLDENGRSQMSYAHLHVHPDDLVLEIYGGYRAAVAIFGPHYNPEDVGL